VGDQLAAHLRQAIRRPFKSVFGVQGSSFMDYGLGCTVGERIMKRGFGFEVEGHQLAALFGPSVR
jgi:hypothetical protein